jgi:acetylornithine/succinyldiaminopimelate/putrescine aminotransferase
LDQPWLLEHLVQQDVHFLEAVAVEVIATLSPEEMVEQVEELQVLLVRQLQTLEPRIPVAAVVDLE